MRKYGRNAKIFGSVVDTTLESIAENRDVHFYDTRVKSNNFIKVVSLSIFHPQIFIVLFIPFSAA